MPREAAGASVHPPSGCGWLCLAYMLGGRGGHPRTLCRQLPARTPLFSRLGWREKAWFRLSPQSHEDAFPITLLFFLLSNVPI